MPKIRLRATKTFSKQYKKIISRNQILEKRIDKAFDQLRTDPFFSGLKTHKVDFDKELGNIWSSRVTGDIRILWAHDQHERLILILLQIGGHDQVY